MNIPPMNFTIPDIQKAVSKAVSRSEANPDPKDLKFALSCIDLTTLNPTDTPSYISSFVRKVNAFKTEFSDLPEVAAICVYPNMVPVVKKILASDKVKIASVAGGFPSSMTFPEIKAEEARLAVDRGADEIDIVLPLWAFLDGNITYCAKEIKAIKKSVRKANLKVIIESGILIQPKKIWEASVLALSAGADYIKTSTGKLTPTATPEAAFIMCRAIKWWFEETGEKRGFKPAGGISTSKEAMIYLSLVKEILGPEWVDPGLFRIGASRLANILLSSIFGKEINHF